MVSIISCVHKPCDSFPMYQSFLNNSGLDDVIESESVECSGHDSMGQGYNEGVSRAKGSILIFCHADIRFWAGPPLWQNLFAELLTESNTGFIGVAGAKQYCVDKLAWWSNENLSGFAAHNHNDSVYMSSFGPVGNVTVLDGVFLACHKKLIKELGPWDESLGWDFYDISMALRAHIAGYKNKTIALPLLHYSIGEPRSNWHKSSQLIKEKFFGAGKPELYTTGA